MVASLFLSFPDLETLLALGGVSPGKTH